MYIVTIHYLDGHEVHHQVEGSRLRHFMELAVHVLESGETLSYRHV
jgi:hypothetical protein